MIQTVIDAAVLSGLMIAPSARMLASRPSRSSGRCSGMAALNSGSIVIIFAIVSCFLSKNPSHQR